MWQRPLSKPLVTWTEWNGWKLSSEKQHGHERFETEKHVVSIFLPSRELTYLTLGKRQASFKSIFERDDMIVPRRVSIFLISPCCIPLLVI